MLRKFCTQIRCLKTTIPPIPDVSDYPHDPKEAEQMQDCLLKGLEHVESLSATLTDLNLNGPFPIMKVLKCMQRMPNLKRVVRLPLPRGMYPVSHGGTYVIDRDLFRTICKTFCALPQIRVKTDSEKAMPVIVNLSDHVSTTSHVKDMRELWPSELQRLIQQEASSEGPTSMQPSFIKQLNDDELALVRHVHLSEDDAENEEDTIESFVRTYLLRCPNLVSVTLEGMTGKQVLERYFKALHPFWNRVQQLELREIMDMDLEELLRAGPTQMQTVVLFDTYAAQPMHVIKQLNTLGLDNVVQFTEDERRWVRNKHKDMSATFTRPVKQSKKRKERGACGM